MGGPTVITLLLVLFSTLNKKQDPKTTHFLSTKSSLPSTPLRGAAEARRFDAVLVDVENVRGRSGFALSHAQVLDALRYWNNHDGEQQIDGSSSSSSCHGKLTLVVDHGHEASSYWIPDGAGYAVVFAGPHCKADDTLALELVPYLQQQPRVETILVVTADAELIQRCRRAASSASRIEIMSPDVLLSDFEKIMDMQHDGTVVANIEDCEEHDEDLEASDEPSGLVEEYELKLGGELLEIEAQLRRGPGMNNKRRKKLRVKGQNLWQKLKTLSPTMLDRVVDVLQNGRHCDSVLQLSSSERSTFLARWDKTQRMRRRKETTHDRIVLAEQLRLDLETKFSTASVFGTTEDETNMSCAKAYVYHKHRLAVSNVSSGTETITTLPVSPPAPACTLQSAPVPSQKVGPLRLVVISDTHGFENHLTESSDGKLPDGDVLLHLGDFAMDRHPDIMMERLRQFDAWLATAAAHIQTKIVLRGNHDCRTYDFSLSKATYVTQAKCLEIAGYKFAFVPYLAGGLRRKASLPKACDILVSHVPPHRILDRCLTGKHAGSKTLLKGAQAMTGGPPFLWLCGHIHESRGVVRHTVFCMNQETTIINAANANSGIASHLEYGPVVLRLGQEGVDLAATTKERRRLEICNMEGQYVFMNHKYPAFFRQQSVKQHISHRMLLAVDLGLRTGVSMFDDSGRLLRYEYFHFDSAEKLQEMAEILLKEWELEVNTRVNTVESGNMFKLTHIAIEGADPPLAEAWRRASNGLMALLFVKPEEWRGDLLTKEEMFSGESSKAASRRMAQQIIAEYGETNVQPCLDIQTDMAESLLLGLHVARRLGWVPLKDPAVTKQLV